MTDSHSRPQLWPLAPQPRASLRTTRARHYAALGLGMCGGLGDDYQDAVLAGIPYRVPNTAGRVFALQRHDLHHVVTGYATDWRGEAHISAWELGSGGASTVLYGWIIALFGLLTGILADPSHTFRAYVRGRRSRNLYSLGLPPLTESTCTLGERLHVVDARPTGSPWHPSVAPERRLSDAVTFGLWSLAAVAWGVIAAPALLGLVVAGLWTAPRTHSGPVQI